MQELEIFKNEEFGEIRTITINNEPWFVGKDITNILGYQNGSRDINRHVDEDDRGSTEMVSPSGVQKNNNHQRIGLIQPYPFQQATDSKEIQALGNIGGIASNPQAWSVHDRRKSI